MGSPRLATRVVIVGAVALAASLVVPLVGAAARQPATRLPTLSECAAQVKSEVVTKGKLTVATSAPALAPWFVAGDPGNQKGYESAIAYKIASLLGFKASQVTWYSEPYELSEESGSKPFDFDINEILYSAKLITKVSFSSTYFSVHQSIVALKTDKIVTNHSPTALKTYRYGDVKGSPGLTFIRQQIKPTTAPKVYASLALAIAALQAGKIDAIVVDVPSGQYLATEQLTSGAQVAQFAATTAHYSVLLAKSSPMTGCVNAALESMWKKGAIASFSKKYLSIYNAIPVIAP